MISFIQPVLTQPRFRKRIRLLMNEGAEAKILSFRRDYFKGEQQLEDYVDLGHVSHGMYILRFFRIVRAIKTVWKNTLDSRILYAFGLDCLFLAVVVRWFRRERVVIVYEIGDVKSILVGRGVTSVFMRFTERFMIKYVDFIVVTSKAYEDEYFRGVQGAEKMYYVLLENKVDSSVMSTLTSEVLDERNEPVRIGYFGLLRCRKTMLLLQALALDPSGRYLIYLRGKPMGIEDFDEIIASTRNMNYDGEYVYPNETRSIYSQVDFVIIAHVHSDVNTRWARVNRFYESGFFGNPMIAQVDSQDGIEVEEMDLGICIDLEDTEKSREQIINISDSDVERWRKNLEYHHLRFCYTHEHANFFKKIEPYLYK